jgi:hypothetical protein
MLERAESDKTIVTLVHTGLTDEIGDVNAGWSYFTGRLAEHFEKKEK